MKLRLNAQYATPTGYVVPRSHLSEDKQNKFAIVTILTTREGGYESVTTTKSIKELKEILGLKKSEKVEIV